MSGRVVLDNGQGMGVQGNMDLGAASTAMPMTNEVGNPNSGRDDLYGCPVEIYVPGYDPLRTTIDGPAGRCSRVAKPDLLEC